MSNIFCKRHGCLMKMTNFRKDRLLNFQRIMHVRRVFERMLIFHFKVFGWSTLSKRPQEFQILSILRLQPFRYTYIIQHLWSWTTKTSWIVLYLITSNISFMVYKLHKTLQRYPFVLLLWTGHCIASVTWVFPSSTKCVM